MKRAVVFVLMLMCSVMTIVVSADNQQNTAASGQAAQQAPAKTPEQLAAERQQAEMALIGQIQQNQTNAEEVARLAEEFCTKYPDSRNIAFVQYMATMAYQRLNNFDKMEAHALAAIQLIPNHPVIPALLANAYAENQKIDKAEEMATRALSLTDALQKPPDMPQADWDQQLGELKVTIHSTLGYVHLQKGSKIDKKDAAHDAEIQKGIDEFTLATQINKLDDISHYRMGISYAMLNKPDESLAAYAKAVAIGRSVADRAKVDMEKIIETLKKANKLGDRTLEGMVAQAKTELGLQ